MRASNNFPEKNKYSFNKLVKDVYVYAILLAVVIVLSLIKGDIFQRGNFLYPANITNIMRMSVPILIISSAFTFIMISGHIDLSVGSLLSLTSVFYSILAINGFGFLPSLLLTLVLGVALGGINGWLVMKMRITPVIATLITMNVYQGIARYLVPAGEPAIQGSAMPDWVGDLARKEIVAGLSWAFIVTIIIVIALVIVKNKTILGKYTCAIGGNRTAAELSGINAVKTVWILYIILGVFSSFAGVVRASYLSIGQPYTGMGVETEAIIAVLLGGTVFTGGEGSVVKSVIGALIIVCLTLGLKTVIPEYWQSLAKGVVLVLAVALNHVLTKDRLAAQ